MHEIARETRSNHYYNASLDKVLFTVSFNTIYKRRSALAENALQPSLILQSIVSNLIWLLETLDGAFNPQISLHD